MIENRYVLGIVVTAIFLAVGFLQSKKPDRDESKYKDMGKQPKGFDLIDAIIALIALICGVLIINLPEVEFVFLIVLIAIVAITVMRKR